MRRLGMWVFAALFSCSSFSSAWAGFDLFSRYHRDQGTRVVSIAPGQILGTVREETLFLTEAEAVQMALASNLEINLERHSQLISFWEIEKQQSTYDPAGTFGLNWDRQTSPTASVLQGGTSLTDIFTTYNLGYQQAFSTGTSFEVGFLGTRNRTTNFFSSLIPAINTEFAVQFKQNLLRGFGKAAAEYQIEISRNNLDITAQEFKRRATDVILRVQETFRELEYALKDIEVKEKSLQLAQTVHEQNQARLEVGSGSRLEVVQTEAELALRRGELVRSRFDYRRLQDLLIRLVTQFEDPRELAYEIVPVTTDLPDGVSQSFERLLAVASEMRPEFQQAELNVENLKIDLDLTRDLLRPGLEFAVGVQLVGLGGTRIIRDFSQGFLNPPIVDVIPGGVGDSFQQLFSGDFYGYTVGLNLQLPIKNRQALTENAQAQISLRRGEMERLRLKQAIALEIRDALTQIEMNKARVEENQAAVRSAQERLEGEQARFDVGMGTTRELIEAQRDLLLAASILVRARADLAKSFALLDKASGQTFDRFNIQLTDSLQQNVR